MWLKLGSYWLKNFQIKRGGIGMRQLIHYYKNFENFDQWCQEHQPINSDKLLIEINYPNSNLLELQILLNELKEKFSEATIIGMQSFGSFKEHAVSDLNINPVISMMEFTNSSISSLVLDLSGNYVKGAKEDYLIDFMEVESYLQPDTQAIEILSSYNTKHTSSLINKLGETFSHLKIFGGGATVTSSWGTSKPFVFHNGNIYHKAVILTFLHGENLEVNLYQAFDWKPISKKKKVSKVKESSLLNMDNSPALDIYKKYFPNIEKDQSVFFQVPLYITKGNISYTVHILDTDTKNQSLITSQNLQEGDIVQLSIGNYNDMMNRTKEIYEFLSETPAEGLWIGSCISYEYGFRIPINYYISNIKSNNHIFGYVTSQEYFNGENQPNTYHNQTFIMAAITESSSNYIELVEYKEENITPFEIANKNLYSIMHKTANELNRLTENLEIRVNQRTKELKVLNADLQVRINDAVRKVNRQNAIMTQQARLASMGEILENIAHQWRQPLNTVSWIMNDTLIKAQLGKSDEIDIEEIAQKVNNSIQFLSNTIEDFRRYVDRSDMAQTFNLKETINSTVMLIKETLAKSKTEVKIDCADDISYKGYENDFKHVIMNLLNNARDAFEEKGIENGVISIRVYHEKEKLIIAVQDNAGGIPKAILNKIFEPYYTTKHKTQGTGLGLYMSKNMIERVNGTIEAISILNQKTTFIIKLPKEAKLPSSKSSKVALSQNTEE
jgi:signal transduction histidine kinase